ncbi:hypothetical protein [Breznakiella homolactica]|uniref:Uncharacterized protein n=1 Tax=Breznakiella homolactica TaxID=2798577 RepID=A0A7T8BCI0_9SPIR|nr:hypothetical protein [Breznakiella homolactica]QQO10278.1 hypothetical protein JFL75_04985 [Breznakiella homolactica]
MSTKKCLFGMAVFAIIAMGFTACSQVLSPEESSVTVQLPGESGGRAYTEAEKSGFAYTVTLTGPGGRTVTAEASAGKAVTFGGLVKGLWLVEVRALNGDKESVAYGSDTVTVTAGNNRALVKMGEIIYSLTQLKGAIDDAKAGDTLYIGSDIEFTGFIEILKNLTFSSLGDYTLSRGSAHPNELFQIGSETVTFKAEGTNTLTLDGKSNPNIKKPLISLNSGATLVLGNGSVLQNNEVVVSDPLGVSGGAVYCKNGKVVVSGGIIRDNINLANNKEGGGFYLEDSEFTMTSGAIYGNTAETGGGLHLINSGFTMTGGEIYGNTANTTSAGRGGGVYIKNTGLSAGDPARIITISGGSVYGNHTFANGGGFYIDNSGRAQDAVVISGGAIYNNIVAGSSGAGGGIRLNNSAKFTMSGGAVYRNQADEGGGMYVTNVSSFTMTGGHICRNLLSGGGTTGGGLYIASSTISIPSPKKGEIKENSSQNVRLDYGVTGDTTGIAVGGENGESDICSMAH